MGTILALALCSQAAGQVFDQAVADGLVVVEAENFRTNTPNGGHTWDLVATPTGFLGAGAMQANPNAGTGGAPRLDFRILFRSTGTHYVWARGRALTAPAVGNNDSIHIGYDGTLPATSDALSGWGDANYTWRRSTMDSGAATLAIATAGVHVVSIVMREDGTLIDRLLITTNAAYNAVTENGTQNGPAESAQIAEQTPAAPGTPVVTPQVLALAVGWGAVANADSYRLERSENGGAFTVVFTGPGLTYTDPRDAGITNCYRVTAIDTLFGAGPTSAQACGQALLPPPRTEDHEEGLLGERCSCGASIPGAPAVLLFAAIALAGFLRRR